MEASALQNAVRAPILAGASPHLRLQSDERLIALVRRGQPAAFEALVRRYESRLLAFCRHMLNSAEDAEDVLQEVFAAAYKAIGADERPIAARPWLYRIARNRCLNHLRRHVPEGQESMDVFERDGGTSTADTVHRREEFRLILADVGGLPETQRTALLLREIDALSYEQIAEAMEATVPSVKSLLVRARMALAEAAEARLLSCAEVRLELSQVAEGLAKSSPQVRHHVKSCPRCRDFKRELRKTGRALAAVYPIGPLVAVKQALAAKLGGGAATAGVGGASGASAGSGGAGGLVSAAVGSVAGKAAAGLAAAALVTAGAVEVKQADRDGNRADSASPPAHAEPAVVPTARTHRWNAPRRPAVDARKPAQADHHPAGGGAQERATPSPEPAKEPVAVREPDRPVEPASSAPVPVEPSPQADTAPPAGETPPPAATDGDTVSGSTNSPTDDDGPVVEPEPDGTPEPLPDSATLRRHPG